MTLTPDTPSNSGALIGEPATGPAPAPAAPGGEQVFDVARTAAIACHRKTLASALMALRGLSDHDDLIKTLSLELEEIITEERALTAARTAQHGPRKAAQPPRLRLVPDGRRGPQEVN